MERAVGGVLGEVLDDGLERGAHRAAGVDHEAVEVVAAEVVPERELADAADAVDAEGTLCGHPCRTSCRGPGTSPSDGPLRRPLACAVGRDVLPQSSRERAARYHRRREDLTGTLRLRRPARQPRQHRAGGRHPRPLPAAARRGRGPARRARRARRDHGRVLPHLPQRRPARRRLPDHPAAQLALLRALGGPRGALRAARRAGRRPARVGPHAASSSRCCCGRCSPGRADVLAGGHAGRVRRGAARGWPARSRGCCPSTRPRSSSATRCCATWSSAPPRGRRWRRPTSALFRARPGRRLPARARPPRRARLGAHPGRGPHRPGRRGRAVRLPHRAPALRRCVQALDAAPDDGAALAGRSRSSRPCWARPSTRSSASTTSRTASPSASSSSRTRRSATARRRSWSTCWAWSSR